MKGLFAVLNVQTVYLERKASFINFKMYIKTLIEYLIVMVHIALLISTQCKIGKTTTYDQYESVSGTHNCGVTKYRKIILNNTSCGITASNCVSFPTRFPFYSVINGGNLSVIQLQLDYINNVIFRHV